MHVSLTLCLNRFLFPRYGLSMTLLHRTIVLFGRTVVFKTHTPFADHHPPLWFVLFCFRPFFSLSVFHFVISFSTYSFLFCPAQIMRLLLVLMCEPLFQRNVDFDPSASRYVIFDIKPLNRPSPEFGVTLKRLFD